MEHSDKIESILTDALEIASDAERRQFVERACGEDAELRRQVEELIENHFRAGSFLESPPVHQASCVVERPGTVIGPYKLLEEIGQGGFGVVFMAEQTQPVRRTVALKVLKPGMDTSQVVARFEAERQALALMDHPNIAKVLDAGTTETGRPYFVMELVKGVPITKFCDEHQLSPRERLALFVPVCEAVQHAHQKGIIHRDIKPSNVLVAAYDGRPIPKVIDFGVAKALGQRLTERTLVTNFGGIIGTLEYMSPEQAEFNALDIDTRADIYGLGVLLYELLTGTTPLTKQRAKEAALTEVLRVIREEEPQTPSHRLSASTETLASISAQRKLEPSRLTKEIRGELDWIVMKCLEKERTRRYQTANGVARDIQRFLNDEAVEAGPPSATYKLRKFARKHRKLIGAAAAISFVLILASVFSVWQAVLAKRAERTAVEEAAISKAINDFLEKDLLGQADIGNQPAGTERNKDLKVRELLDRAALNIAGKFAGQPRTEAAILRTLGKAYQALGEFPEAQRHLDRSLQLRQETMGPDHPDALQSMSDLASLHSARSQYDEAERLYRSVLETRRAKLGADHADTLQTTNDLGVLLLECGRYKEAEQLLTSVLETRRAKLGSDHLDTCESSYEVAILKMTLGQYQEAEALYKHALEGRCATLGPDHPLTLMSMHSLGGNYLNWREHDQAADKYDDAERLYKQVVELRTAKLGADHPDTLRALNDLAAVYGGSGRLDDALSLYEQVLKGWRAKLGPNHTDTLTAMGNLAALHFRRGRHSEAIPFFEHVLDARRAKLSPDHVDLLTSMHNLGVSYRDTGRHEESETLLLDAVTRAKRVLGFTHTFTRTAIPNLADLHYRQGKPEVTEPLLREIVDFHRDHSGPESQAYDDQLNFLCLNLMRQKKFVEAEKIARERLAIRVKNSPDGWALYLMKSLVGEALTGQEKFAEAEPLLVEGYEGMKKREETIKSSVRTHHLSRALERLVKLYDAWGKEAEAARWRKELADVKARPL